MLVGDFMIDDTNYADCLVYTILIMSIRSKARNLFPISLMTISTISALFIIEVRSRNITYDTIQKTILCGFIYLGYDLFV